MHKTFLVVMKRASFILILFLCLLAVGCGHKDADFVREAKDRAIIEEGLQKKQFTAQLIDAAVDLQDKDTFCLVLDMAINTCEPTKADTIVRRAINHFQNLSARKSQSRKKTSMKRVRALVAKTYLLQGDTLRAQTHLSASLRDTIPSNYPAVKEMEHNGNLLTEQFLAQNDYENAISHYIDNLNACNSVIRALVEAKDYKEHMREQLINSLLIFVIIIIIALSYHFIDRLWTKHQSDEEEYESVISSLQDSSDSYLQMLSQLESQQTDNRREVEMLHRQVDKIQDEVMQRMQVGKVIYETLQRGERMPFEYKDADSYLIDYVMLFCPEKYKQWQQAYEKLTPRSYTYLILSDMGHSDKTIQDILSISASSVRSIKSRLNARKRSDR